MILFTSTNIVKLFQERAESILNFETRKGYHIEIELSKDQSLSELSQVEDGDVVTLMETLMFKGH